MKIIMNERLWLNVSYAIITTKLLVQISRIDDTNKKSIMSFIFNMMENKKMIAYNLKGEV